MSAIVTPAAPTSSDHMRLSDIASTVVIVISLLLPTSIYGVMAYSNLAGDMTADARVVAEVVQQMAAKSPTGWAADRAAVAAQVAGHVHYGGDHLAERVSVFDARRKPVTVVGDLPAFPRIVRTAPIPGGQAPLGWIENEQSLRPLIVNAALLSVFGIAIAAALFITLRVIPLRAALRATQALRARDRSLAFANTMLTAATEGSLDAILIVDQDARIISYNQHFVDLWQIPKELVQARYDAPVLETVTSRTKDPAAFLARVQYLYAHPEEEGQEKIETKDGRILDRYSKALHGPKGEYLGRIWFFRDITQRERTAETLRQSEARFKAIFDHARDGIGIADAQTKQVFAFNKSFSRMVGYPPDEIHRMSISDFHPPEAMAEVNSGFARQMRGEIESVNNLPIIRKDGSILFTDISVAPVEIGGRPYILGVFHDVSERKLADDKIKFANRLLEAEIESAPDGVFVVHSNPPDLSFNRNFLEMWRSRPMSNAHATATRSWRPCCRN